MNSENFQYKLLEDLKKSRNEKGELFFRVCEEMERRLGKGKEMMEKRIEVAANVIAGAKSGYGAETIEEIEKALKNAARDEVSVFEDDLMEWLAESPRERIERASKIAKTRQHQPPKTILFFAACEEAEEATRAVIEAYKKWASK